MNINVFCVIPDNYIGSSKIQLQHWLILNGTILMKLINQAYVGVQNISLYIKYNIHVSNSKNVPFIIRVLIPSTYEFI